MLAASLEQLEQYARTAKKNGFKLKAHQFYGSKALDTLAAARKAVLILKSEFASDSVMTQQLGEIQTAVAELDLASDPASLLASLTSIKFRLRLELAGALGADNRARAEDVVTNAKIAPNGTADPATASTPAAKSAADISRNVMVAYGRDQALRDSMFSFLRALKLNPIEWSEGSKATGMASPYVGEIVGKIFEMAQAVVVLLSPDEEVQLRRELCADDDEFDRETGFQARANVYIEAGMALAKQESRTILVQVGDGRVPSDLLGRHILRLTNSPEKRNDLAQRLKTAGCDPDISNQDWYRAGNFTVVARATRRSGR